MNRRNYWIDLAILAAFLVAMEPLFTGIPLHEWLVVGFALVGLVHVALHWDWVMTVGAKYFKCLFHDSRLKFFIDVLLFFGITLIMVSGILISKSILPMLGVTVMGSPVWRILHKVSANVSLILVGVHLGLNWRWIVVMTRRCVLERFKKPAADSVAPAQNAPDCWVAEEEMEC